MSLVWLYPSRAFSVGKLNLFPTNLSQNKYVNSGFPWPFYTAEAGWFMRSNYYMTGKGL